tara:strand:- start:616 stop:1119 length:504 start_codon:yes stop_codon:yes gene_type:complete
MANKDEQAESEKGGKNRTLLIAVILLILIGGGAAYYFLVIANSSSEVGSSDQIVEESEEPERSETLYLQLTESFTIQLRDSGSMMQVKLALRTPYGQPIIDEITAHEIGIRAALLESLSDVEGAAAASEDFRSLIEPDLRDAANAILEEQDIFPGIDLVLFTEFLMQ